MLVALEGIDGSGKGTQTRLLQERAIQAGLSATHVTFPNYGKNPFAQLVAEYLNGAFGEVGDVHPKLASLMFAGDRFASKAGMVAATETNDLVVCDRYVASNLAHQAAKLPETERKPFIEWLYKIEFEIYELPKPDLTIYLEVPVSVTTRLVAQKTDRTQSYTNLKADIHEKDEEYLANCVAVYEYLVANEIAGPWKVVSCLSEDIMSLLEPEAISEKVWRLVRNV